MLNRHKHILVFISILGILLVPVGDIMTIQGRFAKGDDANTIPFELVWTDEDYYNQYVAGYYDNLSWSDWKNYAVDSVTSSFPMNTTKQVTDTGGNVIELFNLVHNALFTGIEAGQDWVDLLFVDRNDGKLKSNGNIMTPDLIDILNQYFKSTPSPDVINTGSGTWYATPYRSAQGNWTVFCSTSYSPNYSAGTAYTTVLANGNSCTATYYTSGYAGLFSYSSSSPSGSPSSVSGISQTYTYEGTTYKVRQGGNDLEKPSGATSSYSSPAEAFADFYGYTPDTEPTWNGDGYYRENTVIDVSLPAIPSIDWEKLSNNYYTEYGDEFVEGDVNNFYYDLAYNYYPATYTYDIPYWLLNRQSDDIVLETVVYEYSLPSVELEEGDASFWQGLFEALPVTVSIVLLGVFLCWLIFTLI